MLITLTLIKGILCMFAFVYFSHELWVDFKKLRDRREN